jgi:hypothetical protein
MEIAVEYAIWEIAGVLVTLLRRVMRRECGHLNSLAPTVV